MQLAGHSIEVTYRIKSKGCGPVSITLNGANLDFIREKNPYRAGAARISMDAIVTGLKGVANQITIVLE